MAARAPKIVEADNSVEIENSVVSMAARSAAAIRVRQLRRKLSGVVSAVTKLSETVGRRERMHAY